MNRPYLYLAAALLIGAVIASTVVSANAQAPDPKCAPYDAVVAGLADGWQEERQAGGVMVSGAFELFANVNTGSWSIIAIRPDGITCLVSSGNGYTSTPTIPGSDA